MQAVSVCVVGCIASIADSNLPVFVLISKPAFNSSRLVVFIWSHLEDDYVSFYLAVVLAGRGSVAGLSMLVPPPT